MKKVYFNGFWGGFIEKTDPINVDFFTTFLFDIYNEKIIISSNLDDADILVESAFANTYYVNYKNWDESFLFTGESYHRVCKSAYSLYTCILGPEHTADNLVFGTNAKDGKHLVIDLFNQEANTLTKNEAPKSAVLEDNKKNTGKSQAASVSDKAITSKIPSRLVIAVDAGHGGEDPGARGPAGTEEKTITFSIAKKLQALINNQPGMKAIMVRKNDYYVSLKDRVRIARAAKANLFVSIHADAVLNADIKGASVYTLSTSGASSEAARWLADSENASDLVDVKLNDKEEVLASVLLDLTQTATQEASVNVANEVLKNFVNVAELHKDSVQKAGFMVLKSPDIPSILVETAFISNASEEVNLLSVQYQTKVANAIFNGIRSYFKQSLPEANVAALGL